MKNVIAALWKSAEYLIAYFAFMAISLIEWPMNLVKLYKYVYAPEKIVGADKLFFQTLEEIIKSNSEASLQSGVVDTFIAILIICFLITTFNPYLQALAVILFLSTFIDVLLLIMVTLKIEEEERISHLPPKDDRW